MKTNEELPNVSINEHQGILLSVHAMYSNEIDCYTAYSRYLDLCVCCMVNPIAPVIFYRQWRHILNVLAKGHHKCYTEFNPVTQHWLVSSLFMTLHVSADVLYDCYARYCKLYYVKSLGKEWFKAVVRELIEDVPENQKILYPRGYYGQRI